MNKLSLFVLHLLLYASTIFPQPVVVSDLRDSTTLCDYLIITPDQFLESSVTLAEHRNAFEGDSVLNAHVATLENVYSTFGLDSLNNTEKLWVGLKWMYEHWQQPFTYVVLMGDDMLLIDDTDTSVLSVGRMPSFIYDIGVNNYNVYYKTSDDVFTMLQESYPWYCGDYQLPLYIGRIPCEQSDKCQRYVEKVITFDTTNLQGKWRNNIIFAGDDEVHNNGQQDFIQHWGPCEEISEGIVTGYFTNKCYLSAFIKDSAGIHSIATNYYFNTVNQGALWSVFFGHGNAELLTDEQFLRIDHVMNFDNKTQPIIFLSFTSSNGKYFTPSNHSMLKQYLFYPSGGCLAYIASSSTTFASQNATRAYRFFSIVNEQKNLSLGKILRMAKEFEPVWGTYHLFGDPALTVSRPYAPLTFTLITSNSDQDTLRCVFTTPLSSMSNFAYEITIPETTIVNQYGYVDVTFIKHIPVKDSTGEFGATFDIPIPGSKREVPLHIDVYTWNYAYEARKDTTLYVDSITAINHSISQKKTEPSVTIHNNRIAIQFPPNFTNKQIKIALYTCNGKKVNATTFARSTKSVQLDLNRLNLGRGIYVLHILSEGELFVKRFVFVR